MWFRVFTRLQQRGQSCGQMKWMDNPAYDVHIDMDDVDIAPDDDGDIYNTPNTTRVDEEETSITPTSTLRLKQKSYVINLIRFITI